MSKGFVWFCQNNDTTDYVKCSIELAKSIKKYNRDNNICVITDEKSKFKSDYVDDVKVLRNDDSAMDKTKWANEHKIFKISPFVHTIKLESDMLWTTNTDWWWYHLWQNDLVFSVDCKNYRDKTVRDTTYRKLFVRNKLPNIYNGLMYFRKSEKAKQFFELCKTITQNWFDVKTKMLINCHDQYPSTDVVFSLAYRIMDPTNRNLVDYDWFKFIHHKPAIQNLKWVKNFNEYLYPNKVDFRWTNF